jgi:undecaprenyl-diphosphatase
MRGGVSGAIPIHGAFEAQLASSFTNRITPAKVGGMALNTRYMVKQGLDTAAAATGVAVSTAAGAVVHVVLSVVAVLWVGDVGGVEISLPAGRTLAVTGAIVVVLIGSTFVIPPLRRWLTGSVVPSIRRSWRSLLEVVRQPANLAALGGGSLVVTVGNIVALTAALAAFGERPPLATIAAVYLAGSALASAAPTPGGLGATEAALVAGLSITGTAESVAIPAVLAFRAATFWLPILPGWLFFMRLQRRGDL